MTTTALHTLKRSTKRSSRRVGRGGKRGKTSGRGMKGQKAHGSSAPRPEMRDTIKKLPKKRGFGKNRARTVNSARVFALPVSLSSINAKYDDGEIVSPKTLYNKGIISVRGKRYPRIKILSTGVINKKITVDGCFCSSAAEDAIKKAGGNIAI